MEDELEEAVLAGDAATVMSMPELDESAAYSPIPVESEAQIHDEARESQEHSLEASPYNCSSIEILPDSDLDPQLAGPSRLAEPGADQVPAEPEAAEPDELVPEPEASEPGVDDLSTALRPNLSVNDELGALILDPVIANGFMVLLFGAGLLFCLWQTLYLGVIKAYPNAFWLLVPAALSGFFSLALLFQWRVARRARAAGAAATRLEEPQDLKAWLGRSMMWLGVYALACPLAYGISRLGSSLRIRGGGVFLAGLLLLCFLTSLVLTIRRWQRGSGAALRAPDHELVAATSEAELGNVSSLSPKP